MSLAALRIASFAALLLVSVMSLTTANTPAEKTSSWPLDFTLSVPGLFRTFVTVRHYRKGEDILNSPPFHLITSAPMTEYHGWYGPRTADPLHGHAWNVRVYATRNPKIVLARAKARDGFEAGLNEGREFLGLAQVATFETFARFRRKHFRWGDAVSFLHSEYQDGPDKGMYVPDNGHLNYEAWGVTREQYTVVASVSVNHPNLANWPDVGVVKSIEAFKRDRHYKIIEKCSPQEFEPSLIVFDQLVDSLEMR
jgi:hypothetical protein